MSTPIDLQRLVDTSAQGDKDERWMATNDICTVLSSDKVIDELMEQKICDAVLKQLDDPSNEVQTVAVKCLAILLKRAQQKQVVEISKKLAFLILDGNPSLRDIYSICMKTLITDVPDSMGPVVVENLNAALITGIDRPAEDVKKECLDNISDLLKRFGHLMNEGHFTKVITATFQQLKHSKPAIRKRASTCLGSLAVVFSDEMLSQLITALLNRLQEVEQGSKKGLMSPESTTIISTIGVISRTVGYKLGKYLDRIVPLFIRFCGSPEDEEMQTDLGNELRESCFPGLESVIYRCPKEVSSYLRQILAVSISFLKYDPNYAYDEDDGDQMDTGDGDDGDDDYDAGDLGSEDDDSSWKVRKAAVKVISAIISAHPYMLGELYDTCADELLTRFKEREENVRLDIIGCYTKLVEMNFPVLTNSTDESGELQQISMHDALIPPSLLRQKSTSSLLENRVPDIVKVSNVQLSGNSAASKIAVVKLLKAVVVALQGGLSQHLAADAKLTACLEKMLRDTSQTLKLETLQFLRVCYAHHPPEAIVNNTRRLLPLIRNLVNDEWYKTIAEALRVLETVIVSIRPFEDDEMLSAMDPSFNEFIPAIHTCVMARLEAQDIDLEIKECGLGCAGTLFRHCGDTLRDQLPPLLSLLQKRMENESTRTATLKALSAMASSPVQLDLSSFVSTSGDLLASFLKQYNRGLKQLTLQTLNALAHNSSTVATPAFTVAVVTEASNLMSDNDLHLAHLGMILVLTLLKKNPQATVPPFCELTSVKLMHFAKSSVAQGAAVLSLIEVLRYMIELSPQYPQLGFEQVFISLYDCNLFVGEGGMSKQSLSNVSKCIAAITTPLPLAQLQAIVLRFAADATADGTNDVTSQLALLSMGEVGQQADLSQLPQLKDVILSCFERPSEEVKLAAAYALGHIAVGSMTTFLPLLLSSISSPSHARQQYLLLAALRETILAFSAMGLNFTPYLDLALPILVQQKDSEEESVRNMVAECLGVLTAMSPEALLKLLLEIMATQGENKIVLKVVANAVKSAVSRPLANGTARAIKAAMETFLRLLLDDDLDVKKAALIMANTAAHHNVSTISSFIQDQVFPVIVQTLQVKIERTVDLGPFKHKVDDNLPLRKLCLALLETLLNTAPDKFDANAIMAISPVLLLTPGDVEEVKLLFIQLLPRLAKHTPGSVAIKVDELIPAFEKVLTVEASRRTTVKVILQLDKFEDVRSISRKWTEFVAKQRTAPGVQEIITALENEGTDTY